MKVSKYTSPQSITNTHIAGETHLKTNYYVLFSQFPIQTFENRKQSKTSATFVIKSKNKNIF